VPITSPCDSITVSVGLARKEGVKKAAQAIAGGTGSHTLPNHMIGKRTVNTTLAKGHHAQTQPTARKFLMFYMIAVRLIKTVHYYF
jgi:hypothetical protein